MRDTSPVREGSTATAEPSEIAASAPAPQYTRSSTTSVRSTPRRGTAPPRPVTALAFNYSNLSHDIRTLFVLAPSMIVLLVLAYFVLH
jgi:hypothetical protein